jgi:hypothetical protein
MEKYQVESNIRIVKPGINGKLTEANGETLVPPEGWSFLPAGDAGVTRKVTSQGMYWKVEVKKGRRTISFGVWAPESTILQAKRDVQQVRSTESYQKKQAYAAGQREIKQSLYEVEFCEAVEAFLNFRNNYKELEKKLAKVVTAYAIPVGSGTVARTQLIPIEERASHAVIAWMRHQTTAYDNLKIARVKGERRAVRRSLAQQSVELLARYREGKFISTDCPLQKALENF